MEIKQSCAPAVHYLISSLQIFLKDVHEIQERLLTIITGLSGVQQNRANAKRESDLFITSIIGRMGTEQNWMT